MFKKIWFTKIMYECGNHAGYMIYLVCCSSPIQFFFIYSFSPDCLPEYPQIPIKCIGTNCEKIHRVSGFKTWNKSLWPSKVFRKADERDAIWLGMWYAVNCKNYKEYLKVKWDVIFNLDSRRKSFKKICKEIVEPEPFKEIS